MSSDELRKPESCPSCSGHDIRQIMYGLPTEVTLQRAERGEVVLGGCCIFDDMPDWRCITCSHEWYDATDPVRVEHDRLLTEMDRQHKEKLRQLGWH